MKTKFKKWTPKYLKMWKLELPSWKKEYLEKNGITLEKAWCIVKEEIPGRWKVIYENSPKVGVWNCSPFAVECDGTPNLEDYEWTEISKIEVEKTLFVKNL